ncbi:hypothetical protein DB313_04910 (plasmid) [Borrelia turcica IST7]|uniref:Uncharacterized protein n=1 Tax=Borrelia turcica IST7 TaxID=1104446 RepID=A0A386PMP6_9SPIR|nr:hypothetical protein [Borrelia turcica]AYE36841.1 hypothetical protein DB313_04910 [Borrelia turcica IST7]
MKLHRVLLILLVILMSCSQQAPKEKAGEKTGITKTGKNKIKQKGVKKNKLDKKTVEDDEDNEKPDEDNDETNEDNDETDEDNKKTNKDNDETDEDEDEYEDEITDAKVLSSPLGKKVKSLREKLKKAKKGFVASGHFKQFADKFYKYNTMYAALDRVDYVFASLEYDVAYIKQVDEVLNKVLHNYTQDPSCNSFVLALYRITELKYNVLYKHLSGENLSKLIKSKDSVKIRAVNKLLDDFIKARSNCIGQIRARIAEAAKKNRRDLMEIELDKIADEKDPEFKKSYDSLFEMEKEIGQLINS